MTRRRKLIIIAVAIIALLTIIIYSAIDKVMISNKYNNLNEYSYSKSGDMTGSSTRITVSGVDSNTAVIHIEEADSHDAETVTTEYSVDIKILQDINEVFIKYNMYKWNNKKFTDMFVCDGATTRYCFTFDNEEISFSSQIYPKKYSSKLAEITKIIGSYKIEGKKL